ncbi:hypothetical protein Y032_0002g1105 [Ancylostoma ceylanicum]|uniref:glucuronosyltransferase n=2 Tax=Ancylostoma ceylanicum TaxID=53326 RepID=A0A016VYX7_9BILA|nr:hypothetical protein Y032_0002g1105 [Ancylostoma ceylanicum]
MWFLIFLISSACRLTAGYNYLVVSPLFGHSHSHFMGTIADTLTEAGHNVTVLMPIMDPDLENNTGLKSTTHVIKVAPDNRTAAMFMQKARFSSRLWNLEPSAFGMIKLAMHLAQSFSWQCEKVLNDNAVMDTLHGMQFDVGIAEPSDLCGFGIFELLKIKSTIAATSCVHADHVSKIVGVPVAPSYVPGSMSSKSDVMDIMGRLQNAIQTLLGVKFFEGLFDREVALFREKYGPDFKGYEELLAQVSYVFTNSNPYLDYPHPTIHKAIDIGGIAVSLDAKKNKLPQNIDEILNIRKTNVVISFGSIVKSCYMPEDYKESLLKVFESMPNTTFIWKYELEESPIVAHLPNVHLFAWLPQNALLADPRISAFVSHGGLGSTNEIAHMGKPAVMVPLFADQSRNANMLAKHGGALVLEKYDIANHTKVAEAIQKITSDQRFVDHGWLSVSRFCFFGEILSKL